MGRSSPGIGRPPGVSPEIGRPELRLDARWARFGLGLALAVSPWAAVTAAPSISLLTARPSYFTPDGDGLADSTEVSFVPGGVAPAVDVRIQVFRIANDSLVATPLPPTSLPAGILVARGWDPGPIADGAYRFDVLVVDGPDSLVQSAVVVADTTAPSVALGAVGPNPFDPASSPPNDLLHIPVTQVVSDTTTATVVRILDADGATTDSVGTFIGAGTVDFTWDGKTSADAAAPTGLYSVQAVAADLAGNADTAAVALVVDRDNPVIARTDSSSTIQTDVLPFTVRGTATDFDRVVAVSRSLDGGATWAAVDSASAPAPQVTWSTSVTYPGGLPGRYSLRVRAQDAVGHVTEKAFTVAYDDSFPEPLSEDVVGSGSVADGDTLKVRSVWSLPGLTVSASFSPIDSDWTVGQETVTEGPPGTYLIVHRISPTNTRATGVKNLIVTASTGIVAVTDTVTVSLVDAGPRPQELVAVSHNRFDPDAGERVTIATQNRNTALRLEIYDLAGERVRKLEGKGSLEWDGRGEGGVICGSGVYMLRVDVNGDIEVRKVAVLRGSGS